MHMNCEILIWNFSREQLISVLDGGKRKLEYTNPMILNEGKNLSVLHSAGVDVWQLESPQISTTLTNKSGFSRMFLLDNGKELMIDFEGGYFFMLEVDTFRIIKEFKLPSGTRMYRQLSDGDLLVVLKNKDYNRGWADKQKKKLARSSRNMDIPAALNMPSIQRIETLNEGEEEPDLREEVGDVLKKNLFFGPQSTLEPERDANRKVESLVFDGLQINAIPKMLDVPGGNSEKYISDEDEENLSEDEELDPNNLFMDDDEEEDYEMSQYKPNNTENQKASHGNPSKFDIRANSGMCMVINKKKKKKEIIMIKTKQGYIKEDVRPELYRFRFGIISFFCETSKEGGLKAFVIC